MFRSMQIFFLSFQHHAIHELFYMIKNIVFKFVQVGIIHAINKLQTDIPNLNLAVSLHAPVQEIRCQIMPAARAFPLERLMNTLRDYQNNRFLVCHCFFQLLKISIDLQIPEQGPMVHTVIVYTSFFCILLFAIVSALFMYVSFDLCFFIVTVGCQNISFGLLCSHQKIFIEYIMLDGVNDEEQHAHQLGKLLETLQVVSFTLEINYLHLPGLNSQFIPTLISISAICGRL